MYTNIQVHFIYGIRDTSLYQSGLSAQHYTFISN